MNEYECCAAVGGVEDQNEKEIDMLDTYYNIYTNTLKALVTWVIMENSYYKRLFFKLDKY